MDQQVNFNEHQKQAFPELPDNPVLLLVDDDEAFRGQMAKAMEKRGFIVETAPTVKEAKALIAENPPLLAIVDLKLGDGDGLEVVNAVHQKSPDARTVILTGYGNITTAVAAVKAGANDYLVKPAEPEDLIRALLSQSGNLPEPPENPMSADRVKWEHIQRVYNLCNGNVSETARRLGMHRRTLQRILSKRAPQ